jgi:hypothetical protein
VISRRSALLGGVSACALLPTKAGADPSFLVATGQVAQAALTSQNWQTLLVGGGGYVTGMDIASDGTKIVKSDTYPGAYVWNESRNKWMPLVLSTSMPSRFVSPRSHLATGCWEARICPSLTTKFYMMYANAMFVTTNSGGKWTQLASFPPINDADANDSFRTYGWKIAVDPQNDAIVYVGTPRGGLKVSSDSGSSWSVVSAVSASSVCGILIAFDPTSGVSNGKKQGLFAASWGHGVWHSTDGGSSWTKLSTANMPLWFSRMVVDQNGKLWVCSQTGGQAANGVYTWTSSDGWVMNSLSTIQSHSITIDPADASRIVASGPGGRIFTSNDGGLTWSSRSSDHTTVTASGDAAWMACSLPTVGGWGTSDGLVIYDPSQSQVCYQAFGFGVWFFNPFANSTSLAIRAQSRGIEALDGNCIIHPPNGNIIGIAWDLPIWPNLNTSSYAATYAPASDYRGVQPSLGVGPGWFADWAKDAPSTIVAAIHPGGATKSTDFGATWTALPSQTPFRNVYNGGCIATSTAMNFVAFSRAGGLYYTTDGGNSWNASGYAGRFPPYAQVKSLCADQVTPGTFYMYSFGGGGVYKSTNNGQSFSRVSLFKFPKEGPTLAMKSVPGNAGHLFESGGFLDTGKPPIILHRFSWSTDGGARWRSIANWTEVTAFGFGTIVEGQGYPTIYAAGWYNGVIGVYKSSNFNPATGAGSWALLGGTSYPEGWYALILDIAGDPNVDGACSIAYSNGGFKRIA